MIEDILNNFDFTKTPDVEEGLVEHLLITVSNMAHSLKDDMCSVEISGWRAEGHYDTTEGSLVLTLRYSVEDYTSKLILEDTREAAEHG